MKVFLKIVIVFVLFINNCYSQAHDKTELVSVKSYIVAKGKHEDLYKNGIKKDYYFLLVRITNQQDTTVPFYIMSGSWTIDNFEINNDSIKLVFFGNDVNTPTRIILKAHQSIIFNVMAEALSEKITIPQFRVGFHFTDIRDNYIRKDQKYSKNAKRFWSNEMKLEDPGIKYEVEE